MSAPHRAWLADEARRTITAPELRPVGQVPCTATSTGLLIGCAYRRPNPRKRGTEMTTKNELLAVNTTARRTE